MYIKWCLSKWGVYHKKGMTWKWHQFPSVFNYTYSRPIPMAQFSGEEKRRCTLCISKSQNIKGNSFVDMRAPAWAIWKLYIWGAWIKPGGSRQVCVFRPVAQLCHSAWGTDVRLLQPLSWTPFLTQETSFPRGLAVLRSHLPVINVSWQDKRDHAWAHGSCMDFFVEIYSLSTLQTAM